MSPLCSTPSPDVQDSEGAPPHVLMSMDHFYSLPWITYRSGFPAIEGTGFTTDCGWGCMVRSGQMLLATALHCHFLGRGSLCVCVCESSSVECVCVQTGGCPLLMLMDTLSTDRSELTLRVCGVALVILYLSISQILSWFGDSPKQLYPFSLHRLMEAAVVMGHHPGDWFGPSQVAVLLRYCQQFHVSTTYLTCLCMGLLGSVCGEL